MLMIIIMERNHHLSSNINFNKNTFGYWPVHQHCISQKSLAEEIKRKVNDANQLVGRRTKKKTNPILLIQFTFNCEQF